MAKPTEKPTWAENDEVDPVTSSPNKIEPTTEYKLSGVKRGQPLPRTYINYQFDLIKDWIDYFESVTDSFGSATLQSAYPVGKLYINVDGADPAITLGFGTWIAIGQGRTLVGVDGGDPDFNTPEETGGSKTHNHTGTTGGHSLTISEMPAHTHDVNINIHNESGSGLVADGGGAVTDTVSITSDSTGSGNAHLHTLASDSNVQPYITVYFFKRTA